MEWADFLNDWKCGGRRECGPLTPIVEVGYKYRWEEYGKPRGIITVTNKNIADVKQRLYLQMNDPEWDIDYYERIDGKQEWIEEED